MVGYVLGGVLRGLVVGAAAAVTALLFAPFHVRSVLVTVAALLLAALVSSLAGFVIALFANGFEQVQAIQGLILTPLMFLGGVFNPISLLPDLARRLSLANPMLYMVNAVRYGMIGIADVSIGIAFAMPFALGVLLGFIAVKLLTRGAAFRE